MQFEHPAILLLLLIPSALALSLLRRSATGRPASSRQAVAFGSLTSDVQRAGQLSIRRHFIFLPNILVMAALTLCILAMAGPRLGVTKVAGNRNGIAIEMLFDISSSMDISIDSSSNNFDRITAAKQVCRDFIIGNNADLAGRQNDIIGLITFARYADTACPMTASLDAIAEIVSNLEIENRPNEDGTAFGDALILAAAHLIKIDDETADGHNIKSKIIILLTDGDNNCGRHLPDQAAALAKKWGIKIYAIFLGDKPDTDNGQQAPLTASQQQLVRISKHTGGICRMVYDYDSLHAVYSEIDALEKSKITLFTDTIYRELYPDFALAAAMCLALSILLTTTILRKVP